MEERYLAPQQCCPLPNTWCTGTGPWVGGLRALGVFGLNFFIPPLIFLPPCQGNWTLLALSSTEQHPSLLPTSLRVPPDSLSISISLDLPLQGVNKVQMFWLTEALCPPFPSLFGLGRTWNSPRFRHIHQQRKTSAQQRSHSCLSMSLGDNHSPASPWPSGGFQSSQSGNTQSQEPPTPLSP